MHALVLCLLEQVMDPAMVALKCPQTAQVPLHATNHTWHAGNRLQEDNAIHPTALIKLLRVISRDHVKGGTSDLDHEIGEAVPDSCWGLVSVLHILYFLLGVDRVGHAVASRVQHDLVLNHLVEQALSVFRVHFLLFIYYNYRLKLPISAV